MGMESYLRQGRWGRPNIIVMLVGTVVFYNQEIRHTTHQF